MTVNKSCTKRCGDRKNTLDLNEVTTSEKEHAKIESCVSVTFVKECNLYMLDREVYH